MNSFKRFIGFALSVVFIVLSCAVPAFAQTLPTYNAVSDFKTSQGGVWRYQCGYNNDGLYGFSDLTYDSKAKLYGNSALGMISVAADDNVTNSPAISLHPGSSSDAVLTFVAPYSGKIEISMANGGVYCPLNGEAQNFDGINFYMCCGSKKAAEFKSVSAKNSAVKERVFDDVYTVSIRKGERIYFIVQPNNETSNDTTHFNPQIEYTSISKTTAVSATVPAYIGKRPTAAPSGSGGSTAQITSSITGSEKDGVYRLSRMFSDLMGDWKYYWFDNVNYHEMIYQDGTWTGGKAASYARIGGGGVSWHPHINGYTVAAFTCPESGTVHIGSEIPVEVNAASADGVIFSVVSENQLLGEQYIVTPQNPSQEFAPIEIDAYKGQVIYFFLYMNAGNSGDSTKVAPYVKYVDYKYVEPYKSNVTKEDDVEPTLRTDVKPIETEEDEFTLNILQILLGCIPSFIIVIAFVLYKIIKRRKKNG
ncbi:MAG: hypothetical protein PUF48_07000 [Oscillospiraceae bacterium]|nr:hypothetical protein [Oscillospiraceae bacterium]